MQSREDVSKARSVLARRVRTSEGHPAAVIALVQLLARCAAQDDYAAALEAARAQPPGQKARRRDETG